jgi:hypothetical protein
MLNLIHTTLKLGGRLGEMKNVLVVQEKSIKIAMES